MALSRDLATSQLVLTRYRASSVHTRDCKWFEASRFLSLHNEQDCEILNCTLLRRGPEINWLRTFERLKLPLEAYDVPTKPSGSGAGFLDYYCQRHRPDDTLPAEVRLRHNLRDPGSLQGDCVVAEHVKLMIAGVLETNAVVNLRKPYLLPNGISYLSARAADIVELQPLCASPDAPSIPEITADWTPFTFVQVEP